MNSEALIKFLASLNPEQHDTLITLLKRCLPAEQNVATWPRHAASHSQCRKMSGSLHLSLFSAPMPGIVLILTTSESATSSYVDLLFVTVCNCAPGVICLYRYFVIFLLVLICFPTAKSFLQRIFTPKKFFGPSGKKILHFFLKTRANPTFFT